MEKGRGNTSIGVTNHKFLASFLAAYQLCLKLLVLGTNGQNKQRIESGFMLCIKDSLMSTLNK